MIWTHEMKEQARQLWQEGFSARQVAAQVGHELTRGAVMGMLTRMGATARVKGHKRSPNGTPRITRVRIRKPKPVFNFASPFGPYPFEEPQVYIPRASEIVCLDIPFHELEPNQCRFIPGEPAFDAPACGHLVKEGKPYCSAHMLLCYQAPSRKGNYNERQVNYLATAKADAGAPLEVSAA